MVNCLQIILQIFPPLHYKCGVLVPDQLLRWQQVFFYSVLHQFAVHTLELAVSVLHPVDDGPHLHHHLVQGNPVLGNHLGHLDRDLVVLVVRHL